MTPQPGEAPDYHKREMTIEYDADEHWLIENDGFGASQVVARDVPHWLGKRVVALLAAPVAGEGLDVERLVEAERAMRKRLRTLAPESCLWMDGVVEHAAGLAYEYAALAANQPVAEERT